MSITSQHGRRVFALQVAGLKYRYHSHPPPASSNLDAEIATGVAYEDIEAITEVGAFSASIDPSGGVAQYSSTSVTLGIDRQRGGLSDPGVVFGRCGARSSPALARLTTSASRQDTTFYLDADVRSTAEAIVHIGAETVHTTLRTATSITVTRGVGGTPIQTHSIGLEGSFVPEISNHITTFRGRRAKLFMAHRYPNGNTTDFVEVLNGFIEASPTIEQGDEISLDIVPLTALIDTDLADKGISQTRLLQGYHYFDGVNGSVLEYALTLEIDRDSRSVIVYPDTTAAITANTFQVSVLQTRGFTDLFDDFDVTLPQGPDADDYIREHPRYPKLKREADTFLPDGVFPNTITYDGSIPGYVINADGALTNALSAGEISAADTLRISLPNVEVKQHELGSEEVKRWPDVINDTLESDGPSSTQGLSGGFARWRLQAGPEIRAEKLSESPFPAGIWLWNDAAFFRSAASNYWILGEDWPLCWRASGTSTQLPTLSRLAYPIDLGLEGEPYSESFTDNALIQKDKILINTVERTVVRALRDIPAAYYQQFESAILVEGSLGLPTSATAGEFYYVTVEHYDRNQEQVVKQVFKCTHETTATFGGSDVGVVLHIANDNDFFQNQSFGDWTDVERALIYRGGQLTGERPGTVILKLLESGGGNNVNGDYDLLGIGLNIDSSDIDERSFLAIDAAATFTLSDNYAGDGTNLRDTIDAMLRLMGAVLVMKRDPTTGRSRLAAVPIGNERTDAAAATVTADQWIAAPPPRWGIREDIVTQIVFEFDFDPVEDKYRSEVIFNNQEAINRYGGERSSISLTLPGVNSEQFGRGAGDNFAYFLPTAARLFNLFANPLRTWSGSIGTGQSSYIDVGSYLTVSSPHLRGYSDTYGVTNGVGMVRSIRQELMKEGCQLELVVAGLAARYWNASARVTATPTATAVTVAADDFSDSTEADASFFEAGDVVDYLPKGNHDGAITGLEVASVTGHTIVFTAAHNITALNGTLEPTTYSQASDNHRSDAYLANSSDIINLTTPAQEFS